MHAEWLKLKGRFIRPSTISRVMPIEHGRLTVFCMDGGQFVVEGQEAIALQQFLDSQVEACGVDLQKRAEVAGAR
jgi:hypothetical protein